MYFSLILKVLKEELNYSGISKTGDQNHPIFTDGSVNKISYCQGQHVGGAPKDIDNPSSMHETDHPYFC